MTLCHSELQSEHLIPKCLTGSVGEDRFRGLGQNRSHARIKIQLNTCMTYQLLFTSNRQTGHTSKGDLKYY